jgi:hypothetical protein
VLRSLPSVYQLLPRQPVLKIGDGYQSIAQATIPLPNINPNMELDAEKFHDEICLGYELLPLMIIIQGHAFAAVSLDRSSLRSILLLPITLVT